MRVSRWDSFDELSWLQECLAPVRSHLIGRRSMPPLRETAWEPPVDVFETDSHVVVRADVSGIDPKMLVVSIREDTLLVRGEVPAEPEEEARAYCRRERHSGPFRLFVALPAPVLPDHLSVTVEGWGVEIRVLKAFSGQRAA